MIGPIEAGPELARTTRCACGQSPHDCACCQHPRQRRSDSGC